jgi:DNA processing protein
MVIPGRFSMITKELPKSFLPQLVTRLGIPIPTFYYRGNIDLLKEPIITIIGTRNPNIYGKKIGEAITQAFLDMGHVTLAGGAYGCDTIVHTVNPGRTIVILGTPLSRMYPEENKDLFQDILDKGGLILSQYKEEVSWSLSEKERKRQNQFRFVERDWWQGRFAAGICLIQSSINGGSHHAVDEMFKIGRMVMVAMPIEKDAEKKPELYGAIYHYASRGAYVIKSKDDYPELDIMLRFNYR